jgi:hypothetical protein
VAHLAGALGRRAPLLCRLPCLLIVGLPLHRSGMACGEQQRRVACGC